MLLFVIRRVEEQLKEPTSQNIISTFDTLGVAVSVGKRPPKNQPQHGMGQFSPKVCEHIIVGIFFVVFLVELLDRVRQLSGFIRVNHRIALSQITYRGDVSDVVCRE